MSAIKRIIGFMMWVVGIVLSICGISDLGFRTLIFLLELLKEINLTGAWLATVALLFGMLLILIGDKITRS